MEQQATSWDRVLGDDLLPAFQHAPSAVLSLHDLETLRCSIAEEVSFRARRTKLPAVVQNLALGIDEGL